MILLKENLSLSANWALFPIKLLFISVWSVTSCPGLTQRCSATGNLWKHVLLVAPAPLLLCSSAASHSTTMLVEEISLYFTESHLLSFYPLLCQYRQVSLTAFSDAMTHSQWESWEHGSHSALISWSRQGSHGCFDCQGVSTTRAA